MQPETITLNGRWQVLEQPLARAGAKGLAAAKQARAGWIPARVPGEIHLDLMRAGRLEEPLVGLNAHKSRWPEKKSWWYRTTFHVPAAFLEHERQDLVFDGLDLYAQVFLNDMPVGESCNAFVPAAFDARRALRAGRNRLVVRLTAGPDILPRELRPQKRNLRKVYGGRRGFPGISHLRKAQFCYGWDWVDALPNIGIWRGVRLEGRSHVVLHEIRADTLFQAGAVWLQVAAVLENLHPSSERHCTLELEIRPPNGKTLVRRTPVHAPVGRSPVECCIRIPNPRLWWPNGMGEQPLYRLSARTLAGTAECDRRVVNIGLRTVELDRTPIKTGGSRFCIRVNGKDVFCKGGNWIPADAIMARVDENRYRRLIDEARHAHFNMLRIWGGGIYEQPAFYDACDRNGILVWQDFMFACSKYPDADPRFRAAVRAEAEAVVRDLRHHPCIALWCGNNENLAGFARWWNTAEKLADRDIKLGGMLLYNQVLPDVCRALDPNRPYWPGSPAGGEAPNSETDGDCHWWRGCTMNPDMNRRIRHEVFDECRARFVSEYGIIGPCHQASVRQFLKPREQHVGSHAWREHTNQFEKDTLPAAITRHYADADKLDTARYILYGQMFQATLYGRSLEALRFRKHDPRDDCQGALIWMYNDCWGEHGWTPLDYYLRRKPSYYWIRNALAPVKAIVRRRGDTLVVRVVNDSPRPAAATLHYGWMRVDGRDSRVRRKAVAVPANGMLEIGRTPIPKPRALNPQQWIYAAWLAGRDVAPLPSVWTLVPHRELATAMPAIRVRARGKTLELLSPVYCHGVHYPDDGRTLFSDNYFDLLPNIPKSIQCLAPKRPAHLTFRAIPGNPL
ncbi:MAG: hypothetical protein JXR37_37575 [Kiritimatiellae bacterium]|nr:hypothetical protein [Kiritimatiellia bacterium]